MGFTFNIKDKKISLLCCTAFLCFRTQSWCLETLSLLTVLCPLLLTLPGIFHNHVFFLSLYCMFSLTCWTLRGRNIDDTVCTDYFPVLKCKEHTTFKGHGGSMKIFCNGYSIWKCIILHWKCKYKIKYL